MLCQESSQGLVHVRHLPLALGEPPDPRFLHLFGGFGATLSSAQGPLPAWCWEVTPGLCSGDLVCPGLLMRSVPFDP